MHSLVLSRFLIQFSIHLTRLFFSGFLRSALFTFLDIFESHEQFGVVLWDCLGDKAVLVLPA